MNVVGVIPLLVPRKSRLNNITTDVMYELDEGENLATSAIDASALVREMGIFCQISMT